MVREFNMKRIYIILSLILVFFSCEKENDNVISGEDNPQRIKSTTEYINGVVRTVNKYFYDENGRVISWDATYFSGGILPTPEKHILEYKTNKIIEYFEGYDPEINPLSKLEREIENGIVSAINAYVWNDEGWDVIEEASYIYNGSNLTSWNQFHFLYPGTKITEGEIIYDGNLPIQRTSKTTYDNYMEMTGIAYRKGIFNYTDEQLQEVTIYRKSNEMVDWKISEKIEYLRSGPEITKNTYFFSPDETWELDETTIFTYNELGNITNTIISYAIGDYVREIVTEYENKPGNWELVFEYPHENLDRIGMNK